MSAVPKSLPSRRYAALAPVLTGLSYYVAAVTSLALTQGADNIATLWPSSGILLAALLATSRRMAGWHVTTAALASLAANLGADNTLLVSIGFTLANLAESVLAAVLLQRWQGGRVSFVDPSGLTSFCVAGALASATSALGALTVAPVRSLTFWVSWFSTDLLGILIVTPLILIVAELLRDRRARARMKPLPEIGLVMMMVMGVTTATFAQSTYPLLFLPMLAVLAAVSRVGALGAAGSVLIVAAVGSIAISMGSGPPSLAREGHLSQSLFLQFYLLALFAAALPMAALLAARSRLVDQLAEKVRLLNLAETAAQVGHWRLDSEQRSIIWSSEVFRIHGVEGDIPPSLDHAIDAYHSDDRVMVTRHIERALEQGEGFEFTARIIRTDGTTRHVLSRGEVDHGGEEGPQVFGIIQDISAQIAHEAALKLAHSQAEEAAKHATIIAETDQLTGIANRRATCLALDRAIAATESIGQPLSIAMFDVDHFKRVNDSFGHQVGDRVLKRVADDAGRELRSNDTLGRFGGEEFVIVLPDATAEAAMSVAERVRLAVEAGGMNPAVTISIGVAQLAAGEKCETLLRRADQALYVAKNEGRNALRLAV